jgi:hypothetical protein
VHGSLENDEYAESGDNADVVDVSFKAGDVVVMDIRTSHRGSLGRPGPAASAEAETAALS